MNLIAITSRRIGAQEVQTVSARDLHTFLEVSTAFTTWITRRVEEYGFVYGRDFLPFLQESSGGRPATEYAITLDMAKELSMVERNSKGREARAYFIDCERRAASGAKAQPAPVPAELSRMDILRLAMESEEARLKAEAERDEAIRTKALIGSRREATAMATAAAAKREAERLRDELGACTRHATVTAVQRATGGQYEFLPLRRWCKSSGVTPADVPDRRYGSVKAWPAAAWSECYGVDLVALFGAEVVA